MALMVELTVGTGAAVVVAVMPQHAHALLSGKILESAQTNS